MAAAAIFNFFNSNNFGLYKDILHQIIWGDARRRRRDDHVTKVETGSLFAWRHQMKVWGICASISVTIAYIWTKFYIELKHRTIDMKECSKFTWLENPRRWKPPSWISENVNNSELDRELFAQNMVGRCITAMRRWHMTKIRNRNFVCVTSLLWWIKMYILNECREHNRCADIKAYKSSELTNL